MQEITIRTDNSIEGIEKIEKLWRNVITGKTSLILTDNTVLVAKYSNYDSDENGNYDLSILAVDHNFTERLEEGYANGKYKKYDFCSEDTDIATNTRAAWQQVYIDNQFGQIIRTYTDDYEISIPANFSEDHKFHCLLYISIK